MAFPAGRASASGRSVCWRRHRQIAFSCRVRRGPRWRRGVSRGRAFHDSMGLFVDGIGPSRGRAAVPVAHERHRDTAQPPAGPEGPGTHIQPGDTPVSTRRDGLSRTHILAYNPFLPCLIASAGRLIPGISASRG